MKIITRTLCHSETIRQHVEDNTFTFRHPWGNDYFELGNNEVAVSIFANGLYDVRRFYYTGEHKEIDGKMLPIYNELPSLRS